MRHRFSLAFGLALLAATPTLAQTRTENSGGTPPGTRDAARAAESNIGNPEGRDLQAYVLMVQAMQERLRAVQQAAADSRHVTPGGAVTPERQALMHETREAWTAMQRAPAAVQRSAAYAEADRVMRQAVEVIGASRDPSREEGMAAAERVQRALDGLRREAAGMAAATGSSVPAPAVAGGGAAPTR
ncbi:MAG: hypothetical protein K2X74_07000 [Acetobacteraceae bacterium]|nr:hypothetical protein [Acetobacteraceae bacterium]